MEKNLIEDLKFSLIMKVDFDILLKNLNILVRSDIDKNLSKFYELKALMIKELHISSEDFEILPRVELNFIKVVKENKFYSINLGLVNSDLNIKILCKEFEWNFLSNSY